jgi:hypothetical protein
LRSVVVGDTPLAWRVGVEGLGGGQQRFDQRRLDRVVRLVAEFCQPQVQLIPREEHQGERRCHGAAGVKGVPPPISLSRKRAPCNNFNPARALRGSAWRAVVLSREGVRYITEMPA